MYLGRLLLRASRFLAAVFILVAVLFLVLCAVLVLVVGLVLVIHVPFLRISLSAVRRRDILPG